METFDGSGIPYGPINNMEETFSDPQVKYTNNVESILTRPHFD